MNRTLRDKDYSSLLAIKRLKISFSNSLLIGSAYCKTLCKIGFLSILITNDDPASNSATNNVQSFLKVHV